MNAAQNPLNNCPYWAGDILTTMSEITPAQRWPGTTWEQITDCMLRAADNTHPAGSTGGAWEITQTVEQLAPHAHYQRVGNGSGKETTRYVPFAESTNVESWPEIIASMRTSICGGGQPMPIANKYTAVYMYRRTG